MNVMYIAPRYHTNQIPLMDGWIKNGDSVLFLCQYQGGTEDYSTLKPVTLGYSGFFRCIMKLYCRSKNQILEEYMSNFGVHSKYGWFPMKKFVKLLSEFKPDLIILRERCIYNVFAYLIGVHYRIPCILYHQNPLWDFPKEDGIKSKVTSVFLPKDSFTPVLGIQTEKMQKRPRTRYIPFVMEPRVSPNEKKYFKEDSIHILSIGKYETRKNHKMLIQVIKSVGIENIRLTIVGECVTNAQKAFRTELEDHINREGMENIVVLRENLTRADIQEEFKNADLFILPSTGEFASISQLEAMACSLAVVCSDKNGTACYIEPGNNGYLFQDNNEESLMIVMQDLLLDKTKIIRMGRASYQLVLERHTFRQYREKICEIISGSLE